MRALVVTNMWPSAERPHWGAFVKSQADSLAAAGVENTLYEIEGWKSMGEYVKALRALPDVARACRADVVHAHYGYSGAACANVKLPLVVSFCGDDLLGRPDDHGKLSFKSRALIPLSKWAARRADGVIVKSEEMRRVIADVADVQVIPNGVNMTRFSPMPRDTARDAQLMIELADAYSRIGDIQGNFTEANAGDLDGATKSYAIARELLDVAANAGGSQGAVSEARASLLLKEAHLAYQRTELASARSQYEAAVAAWRNIAMAQPERTEARANLANALDAYGDFLGRDGAKGLSDPAAAVAYYAEARSLRQVIVSSTPNYPGIQSALYESDLRDGESAWALLSPSAGSEMTGAGV